MKLLVVLGKRLNNDGSFHEEMFSRLNATFKLLTHHDFDIAVLSGGLANRKARITEAKSMFDYLINKGINPQKLVLEEKSKTTRQNAKYSVPIALSHGIQKIYICSSKSHISRVINNPIKLFENAIKQKKSRIFVEAITAESLE